MASIEETSCHPLRMELRLGPRTFGDDYLVLMAIVNRTPDSFYDQGATYEFGAALEAVDQAVGEGADIVDIGGVKAGHGEEVTVVEEARRVAELISEARSRHPDAVLSVDSWRSAVAEEAVQAGADLLNDPWGGVDPHLAEVAANADVGIVCTHAGGQRPRTDPHRVAYADVMDDAVVHTTKEAERVAGLGVRRNAIIVDPGHDLGKNARHSLEITRRLDEMAGTRWPVLVSLSNKDFVGETLDLPVQGRVPGTLAATAICAWLGARIFRAHNVRETRQVLDMVASIRGTRPPSVARRGLA